MSERALITGGAGCIGSDLAERLVARGDDVVVIDNLSSGKQEHIAGVIGKSNFEFVQGDLLDPAGLDSVMPGVTTVYHLAANPEIKFKHGDVTDKDLRQNTIATYHVLESMRQHGVRRIAFSSTSAVYGISERQPIPEDAPTHPISLYGATKLACEAFIGAFAHLFEMRAWIFRFANIVGPKVRRTGGTVIGDFIGKLRVDPTRLEILGNGRQAKSYLLSEECVDAMLYVISCGGAAGAPRIYNLGCEDSVTVTRIADLIVNAMNLEGVRYEFTGGEGGWPGDVPRFLLDVSAINALGWRARHTSEDAVISAIRSSLAEPR